MLGALDQGPIDFTAYISPGPSRAGVRQRLSRYTRASLQVHLHFADPARHPQPMRRLDISGDGAAVVHYHGHSQTLTDYSEAAVANALQRPSPGGTRWIVFVGGHGERDPHAAASAGYQTLARALDAQGLAVRRINLIRAGAIHDNTAVLVIAAPQSRWLPGEIAMVRRYIAAGGNLLWLDGPDPRHGLAPLAQALGLHWLAGTLVYPDFRRLGTGSPEMAVVAHYPASPATAHLQQLTLFPFAGAIAALPGSTWHHHPLLRSPARS